MTREEILAMPAGRELDALVAGKVMGLEVVHWYWPVGYQPDNCEEDAARPELDENYHVILPPKLQKSDHPLPSWYDDHAAVFLHRDMANKPCRLEPVQRYSANIADAWLVVEKLGVLWFVDVSCLPGDCSKNPNPKWEARIWDAEPCISGGIGQVSGLVEHKARADAAPLAICRASLLATLDLDDETALESDVVVITEPEGEA